MFHILNRHR